MATLMITRGLPASGKTTFAKNWVGEDPDHRARINRDDLRSMAHGEWRQETERQIQAIRDAAVASLLKRDISVVVDDTNLPSRSARDLRKLAVFNGAEFEVMDLTNVELETCLKRNAQRDDKKPVPEDWIRTQYQKYIAGRPYPLVLADESEFESAELRAGMLAPYVADPSLPKVILCDLDGTVALKGDRSPYDETRVHEDRANDMVIKLVKAAAKYLEAGVVFVSGRTEGCRDATVQWLWDAGLGYLGPEMGPGLRIELHMRPVGDGRKDSEVKYQIFNDHIRNKYNVQCVFDDRNQVVEMWRSIGLTVFQVADGNF